VVLTGLQYPPAVLLHVLAVEKKLAAFPPVFCSTNIKQRPKRMAALLFVGDGNISLPHSLLARPCRFFGVPGSPRWSWQPDVVLMGSGYPPVDPTSCFSTLKKFGSTSLPPEVQQQAAKTPENFGSESACKIRSPLSGHLSLESIRKMRNVLTLERFLTIHFAY
jgi:hypothetical protein